MFSFASLRLFFTLGEDSHVLPLWRQADIVFPRYGRTHALYRFFLYCLLLYELVSVGWIAYCTRLSVVYKTKTSGGFSTVVSPPPCRTNHLSTTMSQAPQATCCTAAATWIHTIIYKGEHTKCIQTRFVWWPWEEIGTQKKHLWSPGDPFFFTLRSTWYLNLAKLKFVWKRYFPTSMTIFKREKNRILPESKQKRLNWCLSIRIHSTVHAIVLSFKSPIRSYNKTAIWNAMVTNAVKSNTICYKLFFVCSLYTWSVHKWNICIYSAVPIMTILQS